MRKPDSWGGSGFSDSKTDGSASNILSGRSDIHPAPGDLSAALYGPIVRDRTGEVVNNDPVRVAPYTAEPAIERSARFWHRAFLTMADQSGRAVVDGLLSAADAIRAGRCDVASLSHNPTLLRAARRRLEAAVRAEVERGRAEQ